MVGGYGAEDRFFSAVGEAEPPYGAAIMPAGRRRETLASDIETRILPFDSGAARAYAEIASTRRASRRPVSQADCQIAAIARSRDMAVVTRNVPDFMEMGIDVIDPWTDA